MRKWVVLWLASLIVVAALASALSAQPRPRRDYRIVSGSDIGFRVEGTDINGKPTGTFMIRVDGEWVETSAMGVVRPAR